MRTIRRLRVLCLFVVCGLAMLLCVSASTAQELKLNKEDSVRLKAYSNLGVPLHPASGDHAVSGRLPQGTIATVEELDDANKWVRISAEADSGWIIRKYIAEVFPPTAEIPADLAYVVGSWNLEHFHEGATRGFPEYGWGGPTYPPRTQSDYETIASVIENLESRILVLEEVYAKEVDIDGESDIRSEEVERLIDILGTVSYDYTIAQSGGSQHIAILYDKRYVRLNAAAEFSFPNTKVNKKRLFDRQPVFAHFTFLHAGKPMNDLVIVGVHLASGQDRTKNHDAAMKRLVKGLQDAREDEWCIPSDENDILITGDFNANRFDNKKEDFWDEMEDNGWDVLADNSSTYPATRLSGHPLKQDKSKIDYIIVTKGDQGLAGEEVSAVQATVHDDLIGGDPESFRCNASDHIPVTVKVRVMADTDKE